MTAQPDGDNHTPDQWDWHIQHIASIMRRWRDGHITTDTKRREIAAENHRYYGDTNKRLTRTPRRYELPAILADAAGIDEEAMTIALNARRENGAQAYDDIVNTAREPQAPSR